MHAYAPSKPRGADQRLGVVLIYVMGISAAWQLGQQRGISSVPAFPAHLVPGSALVTILGGLWLVATAGLAGAAIALSRALSWGRILAIGATLLSLALCLAWWHDAGIDAALNVAVLAGLKFAPRAEKLQRNLL